MNMFLKNLDITFRRDPTNFRPRINKLDSIKDHEQKVAGEAMPCGVTLSVFSGFFAAATKSAFGLQGHITTSKTTRKRARSGLFVTGAAWDTATPKCWVYAKKPAA